MKITTVGIDIAKSVFHVFAVNKMGTLVKKKQLKCKELLGFIAQSESFLPSDERFYSACRAAICVNNGKTCCPSRPGT